MNHKKFRVLGTPLLSWQEGLALLSERFHAKELTTALPASYSAEEKNILPQSMALTSTLILDLDPTPRNMQLFDTLRIKERAEGMCLHDYHVNCQLYMSLCAKATSHGKHIDISDVFHWQQQGETDFTVWEDGQEFTYTLLPGDCVFIPAGVYHDTCLLYTSPSPRDAHESRMPSSA